MTLTQYQDLLFFPKDGLLYCNNSITTIIYTQTLNKQYIQHQTINCPAFELNNNRIIKHKNKHN